MAFYDQYYDLADQLNDTADDNLARCKRWINWTYRDLANMYNFPELQESVSTTASSYDFKRLTNIKTAATVILISDEGADTDITATVYGYGLAAGVRTYQSENIALLGTATATGSENFSVIDRIELAETLGNVTVVSGSVTIGTIIAGETKIANDFKKIVVVNANGDVEPMSVKDRKLKYNGDGNINSKIYTQTGSKVTFYGLGGATPTIDYNVKHPWLVDDYDESPLFIEEADVVDVAWKGWGIRFEDENDGTGWKAQYEATLENIIANATMGSDMASGFKRGRQR